MAHGRVELREVSYGRDRPRAENPVLIQDVTLRDGHQSLLATRLKTEDLLKVAEKMDQVGFWAMEVWGGATFDVAHRFLDEDPWERLRLLRQAVRNTRLSMLLRGQNLVGYRNYPDDVVEAFVERAAANGIDVFRVFDALNDFRNFETAAKAIRAAGKHFQATICYSLTEPRMGGEVYNLDYYLEKARQLDEMGADSICIKDMAGLMAPYDAFQLVSALKDAVSVPIHLHTHATSGLAPMTQLKAIEAGVDLVDTCMAPLSLRSSHPAVEPLVVTLLGTSRDTGLDLDLLAEIDAVLEREVLPGYRHLLDDTRMAPIDIQVLLHQTPGGMLSNLVAQLREADALDRLEEVFEALPKVRRDLGQVPLVTPTSQIVGTQAVNNVLFGPYKLVTNQVKDLCYGLYGRTPRPIEPDLQARALKGYPRGSEPISVRPAEVLEPELEKARKETEGLAESLEEVLVYALYPVTGKAFLRRKRGLDPALEAVGTSGGPAAGASAARGDGESPPEPESLPGLRRFHVFVDGDYFQVAVAPNRGPASPAVRPAPQPSVSRDPSKAPPQPGGHRTGDGDPAADGLVTAPMPGLVISLEAEVGSEVSEGDPVLVLEAMKMQNTLEAPRSGRLVEFFVRPGQKVERGAPLYRLG